MNRNVNATKQKDRFTGNKPEVANRDRDGFQDLLMENRILQAC